MKRIIGQQDRKRSPVTENPFFITLMRVARQDDAIRTQLLDILSLDAFHRKSALNTLIERMQYKRAPEAFLSAVSALRDDSVAEKALALLHVVNGA